MLRRGRARASDEERDEGVVGGAVDWRRRQADQNGAAPRPVDAGARRARNDADVENGGRQLRTTADCKLPTAN